MRKVFIFIFFCLSVSTVQAQDAELYMSVFRDIYTLMSEAAISGGWDGNDSFFINTSRPDDGIILEFKSGSLIERKRVLTHTVSFQSNRLTALLFDVYTDVITYEFRSRLIFTDRTVWAITNAFSIDGYVLSVMITMHDTLPWSFTFIVTKV